MPSGIRRTITTYRDRVEELIERKRRGEAVVTQEQPRKAEAEVVDFTDALRASIKATRERRAGSKKTASGERGRPEDVAGLTKTELVKKAAALEISGRSRMSRDELIEAIVSASGSDRPRIHRRVS